MKETYRGRGHGLYLRFWTTAKVAWLPLTVSIADFHDGLPVEDARIRSVLENSLARSGKFSCDVSAMVIFPFKVWKRRGRPDITSFSDFYLNKYLPRLRALDSRNRRGTYFERMISFQGVRVKNGKLLSEPKNQLQHIIGLWPMDGSRPRPRQSALQVACFDPVRDHNGSCLSGFPCLQQVSFTYDNSGGLAVNAYYPTQYIFDRAYGNYLGLCHLGYFMASQLGLAMVRLNCFIGRPELGDITKSALAELRCTITDLLGSQRNQEAIED